MNWGRNKELLLRFVYSAILFLGLQYCKQQILVPVAASANTSDCKLASNVSHSPTNFQELSDLINALPKPLSLPCFIYNLSRPFNMLATSGQLSVQPAVGVKSPRIFIFNDQLVTSVVPAGVGKNLAEFSLLTSPGRSIKAEIEFPITENITTQDLFDNVSIGNGTRCFMCHGQELAVNTPDGSSAFESAAIFPNFLEFVNLENLKYENSVCDKVSDFQRCALLEAIFAGETRFQDFPNP